MKIRVWVSCAAIAASVVAAASQQGHAASAFAPHGQKEDAVAMQINSAHSGSVDFAAGFSAPLTKLWSKDLGGSASYALVAEGKTLVVVDGNDVFGLDLMTGNKDWEHLVADGTMGGAYDQGQLFLVSSNGLMTALKAKSGRTNWSAQMPGQYGFSSPPVALKGQVFTSGAGEGGTVYGVDEATGHVNWTQSVANGEESSPAYGDGGLYVSYPCQYYKFALDGHLDWHYNGGCDGGGGDTASYFRKRVYMDDGGSNFVLNSGNGAIVGTYSGGPTPAFYTIGKRGYGLTLTDNKLYCFDVKTGNVAWSFAGDGNLIGMPIVVNGQPVIGSWTGAVFVLDGTTGSQLWTDNPGGDVTSLAAGEGKLVVVSDTRITVYAPQ